MKTRSVQLIPAFCFPAMFAFLLLFPTIARSQIKISGTVLSNGDKKGISDASVFFNNATIGTTTDSNGQFILSNITPGKYELVITVVGFSPFHQPLLVQHDNIDLGKIELSAKAIVLREVRITNNEHWQRNLKWFRDGFLGTTSLARDCEIINPEILDMVYKARADSLIVSTEDFLIIQNNALGYKIKYLISQFVRTSDGVIYTGSVAFEEMHGTDAQQKKWAKKRREVYLGSAMHFFRSAISDRLQDEGFTIFQCPGYPNLHRLSDTLIREKLEKFKAGLKSKTGPDADSLAYWTRKMQSPKILYKVLDFPLNAHEFVQLTDENEIFALGCENDGLYIVYNKNRKSPSKGDLSALNDPYNERSTMINFGSPHVFFDVNGWVLNPNGMLLSGAWIRNRVAGLLPMDYQPGN